MEKGIREKLEIILKHWMEHNREHASEYEKWSQKAKEEGLEDVSAAIERAIEVMQESNGNLFEALELLKKRSG